MACTVQCGHAVKVDRETFDWLQLQLIAVRCRQMKAKRYLLLIHSYSYPGPNNNMPCLYVNCHAVVGPAYSAQ
jgi:hypothetical protein